MTATAVAPRTAARRASGDGGAVLVEAALVTPVFLLILFGVIDFGVLMNNRIGLQQSVREGARQAVVANLPVTSGCTSSSTNNQLVVCMVRNGAGVSGQSTGNVEVQVKLVKKSGNTAATAETGDTLSVCAQLPGRSTTGLTAPFIGSTMQLKAESTMLVEQPSSLATSPTTGQWSWCG